MRSIKWCHFQWPWTNLNPVFNSIYKKFLLYTTDYNYPLTTFRCPSDILFTFSWLFTTRWSTWPRNHLVPCVAELVGSYVLTDAHWDLSNTKCLLCQSDLLLCLPIGHFCLALVDDMLLFQNMLCDGWFVSYTTLPCSGGSGLSLALEARVCVAAVKESTHLFVLINTEAKLPDGLCNLWNGTVLARDMVH